MLGEHWCQELVEQGMVSNTADLFFLTKEQLLRLDRMGEKLAERVLWNIRESREQPLERVLYSLGIFRLGRDVSGKLATRYGSMEKIEQLGQEQLETTEGIGPGIARSVVRGFRTERVKRTLELMREAGVNMTKEIQKKEEDRTNVTEQKGTLEGKTLVITGKLDRLTRQEAESLVRRHSGNAASSVTGNTDYLVVGEKPGLQAGQGQGSWESSSWTKHSLKQCWTERRPRDENRGTAQPRLGDDNKVPTRSWTTKRRPRLRPGCPVGATCPGPRGRSTGPPTGLRTGSWSLPPVGCPTRRPGWPLSTA